MFVAALRTRLGTRFGTPLAFVRAIVVNTADFPPSTQLHHGNPRLSVRLGNAISKPLKNGIRLPPRKIPNKGIAKWVAIAYHLAVGFGYADDQRSGGQTDCSRLAPGNPLP